MKKLLAMTIMMLVLISMVPLFSQGAAESTESDKLLIGFSNWSRRFEFYVEMEKGMHEVADARGVDLILQDANGDLAAQTKQLENFISRGADGIIIVPIDSQAAGSEVEMVNAANIPLVTVDIAVTGGGDVESHVASNNFLGGQLAADFIGDAVGSGKIAVIDNPTITSLIERRDGFVSTIKENYPKVEIVAIQSGESTREKGLSVAENLLERHPDLKAIFGTNDMMALGALQAVKAKNMSTIIVGFDATAEACTEIAAGSQMAASIAQQPRLLGAKALEALLDVIEGKTVEATTLVEVKVVSAENVSDYLK
jgi:ribose transport system substrate-binding protein